MADHIRKHSDLPTTLAGLNEKINLGKSNKKFLWRDFAQKLSVAHAKTFLPEKVKRKWHRLIESFKKAKDNNCSTGRAPSKFQFFNEIDALIGDDHDIQFPVTATASGVVMHQPQQVSLFLLKPI